MIVLGLDTSTPTGSIALIDDETIICEDILNVVETHSAQLMPALDEMLRRASISISDIDAVSVTKGPGSFTGVRIGVATAKGLAYAAGKPIIGVVSLDVLAFAVRYSDMTICPMIDARRNEVYSSIYKGGRELERIEPYLCSAAEKVLSRIDETTLFLGSGARKYRSLIEDKLGEKAIFAERIFDFPRGSIVALLGYRGIVEGHAGDPFSLVPFYIRRSEAEVKLDLGELRSKSIFERISSNP